MKKIGFILLALVLAIGLVGVAYASGAWESAATVNASWTAGTVIVGAAPGTNCVAGTPITGEGGWYTGITANLTNVYPGDEITVTYELGNLGTLPVTMAFTQGANDPSGILADLTTSFVVTAYGGSSGFALAPNGYASFADFTAAVIATPVVPGAMDLVTEHIKISSNLPIGAEGASATSYFIMTGSAGS